MSLIKRTNEEDVKDTFMLALGELVDSLIGILSLGRLNGSFGMWTVCKILDRRQE